MSLNRAFKNTKHLKKFFRYKCKESIAFRAINDIGINVMDPPVYKIDIDEIVDELNTSIAETSVSKLSTLSKTMTDYQNAIKSQINSLNDETHKDDNTNTKLDMLNSANNIISGSITKFKTIQSKLNTNYTCSDYHDAIVQYENIISSGNPLLPDETFKNIKSNGELSLSSVKELIGVKVKNIDNYIVIVDDSDDPIKAGDYNVFVNPNDNILYSMVGTKIVYRADKSTYTVNINQYKSSNYNTYLKKYNFDAEIETVLNGGTPTMINGCPLVICESSKDDAMFYIPPDYIPSSDRSEIFTNPDYLSYSIDILASTPSKVLYRSMNSSVYRVYSITDGTLNTDMYDGEIDLSSGSDDPSLNPDLDSAGGGTISTDDDLAFLNDNDLGVVFTDDTDENGNPKSSGTSKLSDHKKTNVVEGLGEVFRVIFSFVLLPLNLLFDIIFALILSLLEVIIATIKYALKLAGQTLCTWGAKIFDFMIDSIVSILHVFMSNVLVPVQSFLQSTFGGIITTVVQSIEMIYMGIKESVTKISEILYSIFTGVENVFQTMHDVVSNVITSAGTTIQSVINEVKDRTASVLSQANNNNNGLNGNITDSITTEQVETPELTITDTGDSINDGLSSVENNMTNLKSMDGKVNNEANTVPQSSQLQNMLNGLMNGVDYVFNKIIDYLPYILVVGMFVAIGVGTMYANNYIIKSIRL